MTYALSNNPRPEASWQETLFEIGKERLANDLPLPDDDRVADFSYLLPLPVATPLDALVVGGGWGALPVRLASWCRSVRVCSPNPEAAALLRRRSRAEMGTVPISVVDVTSPLPLPVGDAVVDCAGYAGWVGPSRERHPFRGFVAEMYRVLKPGGVFFCTIGNRWSLQQWLRNDPPAEPFRLQTLSGYRRTLRTAGFEAITAYGPLPRHDGIPLCYLPLEDRQGLRCFVDRIFPLFAMVSPESKRAYAVEYRIARWGVGIGRVLSLTPLMKYFLSGYLLIARKPAGSSA